MREVAVDKWLHQQVAEGTGVEVRNRRSQGQDGRSIEMDMPLAIGAGTRLSGVLVEGRTHRLRNNHALDGIAIRLRNAYRRDGDGGVRTTQTIRSGSGYVIRHHHASSASILHIVRFLYEGASAAIHQRELAREAS